MEEKTIIALVIGCLSMTLIGLTYLTYMIWGPGGDGVIFASVVGSIGAIAAGIIGFKFGSSGAQTQTTESKTP